MRAAVYYGPGDIRIEDVARPESAREGEVLIKVLAAAICGTDSAEFDHGPILAVAPVILGHEFVGEVIGLGAGVNDLAIGDRVVSGAGVSCGLCDWCRDGRTNLCQEYYTLGLHVDGGLADFVKSPAAICRRVPDEVDSIAAALAQPFAVALHALRRTRVRAGAATVIIGVGGIGGFLLAGSAARGAAPLIAIDIDDERLETARKLGASHTFRADDPQLVEAVKSVTDGLGAHCIVEATGVDGSPQRALEMVRRGGDVLILGLHTSAREMSLLRLTLDEIDLHGTLAHVCHDDLLEALEILRTSPVATLVVDRVITLENLMSEGIMALVERRAKGKIVVDVAVRERTETGEHSS